MKKMKTEIGYKDIHLKLINICLFMMNEMK